MCSTIVIFGFKLFERKGNKYQVELIFGNYFWNGLALRLTETIITSVLTFGKIDHFHKMTHWKG